jgi:hypothetical protein
VRNKMRNPFLDPFLRKQFDNCVTCYDNFHRDIRPALGQRCRGNSTATMFWRGFDNIAVGMRAPNWPTGGDGSFGYAAFRAGQEIAKREAAKAVK